MTAHSTSRIERLANWPWPPGPDYRRFLHALRRQGHPGFVPFWELFADREVIAAVLGVPAMPRQAELADPAALEEALDRKIRFWHGLGYDTFCQGAILDLPDLQRLSSADTALLSRERRFWVDEKAGAITSWAEFESYPWPSAADADLFPLEYVARRLPEGMGIVAAVSGVLEPVMWLMGYVTFAMAIYDQPDLVEALFGKIAEIFLPLARTLVQMDRVVALCMGDDMGYRTSTMVSPEHLRRFVFPIQKQIAAVAHAQGMPFILHSCGNLEGVMDDLVAVVGMDAKHSFEDTIEPVECFVARHGDRVAAVGGIDMDLLARGTEEQVRLRTRQVLDACAPSRGYVLGSGNSIANYVVLANFLAMLEEGWRFNTRSGV